MIVTLIVNINQIIIEAEVKIYQQIIYYKVFIKNKILLVMKL